MRGGLRQEEAIGLLLISMGLAVVTCLLRGDEVWPRSVPGVLLGLAMISFGWSMRSRGRRQRSEPPEDD